jgi:hypothetical protein
VSTFQDVNRTLKASGKSAFDYNKRVHQYGGDIHPLLVQIIEHGGQIFGGFPLWLIGGSPAYSDIDVFTNSWPDFYRLDALLGSRGKGIGFTPRTTQFDVGGTTFQLVNPGARVYDDDDLLNAADLSPSACLLTWTDKRFAVFVRYPEDIKNRVCRVLERHDWTDWRLKLYQERGYRIIK